jgi:hypothetical protein
VTLALRVPRREQFRGRCLRNWPTGIESPHLLEIPFGEATTETLGKVASQLFEQPLSVASARSAALFLFDDTTADKLVRSGHDRVHRSGG